jgi:putative transposase
VKCVNQERLGMHAYTDGQGDKQPRRALRDSAGARAACLNWLLGAAWYIASSLIRWLLSLLLPCKSQRTTTFTGPRMYSVRRLAAGWGESGGSRHPLAKPDWVKSAVLRLAHDLPQAGCRTLAHNFNLAYAPSNQTVSKTWVASLLKARAAAIALARRKSRRRERFAGFGEPIQRVWGIDLTGLPLTSGETVAVWGIVDHGSRTVLQLEPLARFSSLILLGKLLIAFGEYGLPKAIRSDNASVFRTMQFRAMLKLLGVRQQFTQLHSPWQNGRIERFWRTLKETLDTTPIRFRQGMRMIQEQMRFASIAAMESVLREFRDFYNYSRPHQALSGRTPAMVWNGQVAKKRAKNSTFTSVKPTRREDAKQAARAPPSL